MDISIWQVAKAVFVYLGIPFIAGIITRSVLVKKRGKDWYDNIFMKKLDIRGNYPENRRNDFLHKYKAEIRTSILDISIALSEIMYNAGYP